MRKRNFFNVKNYLEWVISSIEDMQERDKKTKSGKYPNSISLPPIDIDNLRELRFIAKCILNKHSKKKTRKDIYIERK